MIEYKSFVLILVPQWLLSLVGTILLLERKKNDFGIKKPSRVEMPQD